MIYVTALEFNARVSLENFWLVGGVVTHGKAKSVHGGLSEVMKEVLTHWVKSTHGILNRAGFSLTIDEEHLLARFSLHAFVADESALSSVLSSKSASGMKPCAKCFNIISKYHGATWEIDDSEELRDITSTNYSSFLQFTDEQVFDIQGRLKVVHDSQSAAKLATEEKLLGFNFCSTGLLADPLMRIVLPPSKCYYDFLHCLFSNGIVGEEVSAFWSSVRECTTLRIEDLQMFCQQSDFKLKHSIGDYKLKHVFDPKYLEKDTYGGDAGYTVLALFLLEIFALNVLAGLEPLQGHVLSLTYLCWICRWYFRLRAGKCKGHISPSERMMPLISRHLRQFILVYGRSKTKPKHHFNFHCAQSMNIQETVLDCWTMERKHRTYKNVGRHFANHEHFERSILCKLLMVQEEQLTEAPGDFDFTGTTRDHALEAQLGCQQAYVSKTCFFNGQSFMAGDVCLFENDHSKAGTVLMCVAIDWSYASKKYYLLIHDMSRIDTVSSTRDPWHLSEWKINGSKSLVCIATNACKLLWPLCWWKQSERIIVSC